MSESTDIDPKGQNLEGFLEDLASAKPAPGGGSAAAVAGGLAAALSSMVANLTVGKDKYSDVEDQHREILEEAEKLRRGFLKAIREDIDAYNAVMDCYKLPKETEEQKKDRSRAIQTALKGAVEPPFKMAEMALDVLRLSKECAETGNSHAVTDAGASAILAEASLKTALLNVDINLSSISDKDFVKENRDKRKRLTENAREEAEDVVQLVNKKL